MKRGGQDSESGSCGCYHGLCRLVRDFVLYEYETGCGLSSRDGLDHAIGSECDFCLYERFSGASETGHVAPFEHGVNGCDHLGLGNGFAPSYHLSYQFWPLNGFSRDGQLEP